VEERQHPEVSQPLLSTPQATAHRIGYQVARVGEIDEALCGPENEVRAFGA
jgi:hypothetical protein